MKLHSSVCVGFLIMYCFTGGGDTPLAVSDYCEISKKYLSEFKLTQKEADALKAWRKVRVEDLAGLRRTYRELCINRVKEPQGR